jgi:asparagine synthase (glutamine-hydrolysing)
MCGIIGFNWEDQQLAKKMASTLIHRGPDDGGVYTDKGISLGHRRLSIIDLTRSGKQPLYNEDRSLWITYNGEIYNFKELRAVLKKKGHKFISNTDTEVILHGYEEWGEKVLPRLNGMFAFAIWNSRKKTLFLARDRIGIKPLYYYWDGSKFIFASELKAIFEASITRQINTLSLQHYLTYGFTPKKQTMIRGICKLEPGHALFLNGSELRTKKYWQLNIKEDHTLTEDAIKKKIKLYLEDAVKKRLMSDVPLGAFLSGGIDSSALVAMASKYKKNLKTFSIGFEYDEFNEAPYAKKVSELFATEHHEKYFVAKDFKKLIPKLAFHYDDPLADYSILPTYLVSTVARKKVKVVLGGDGGDELFGGYNWYRHYMILEKQKHIPLAMRKYFIKPSFQVASKVFQNHLLNKTKHLIETEAVSPGKRFAMIRSFLSAKGFKEMNINPKVLDAYSKFFTYSDIKNNFFNADLSFYLPGEILHKVDKATMAVGLEARVPFLDHTFVEFASTISSKYRIHRLQTKYLLKKSLRNVVPKEIIHRKKRGFGVPIKQYFRNELRGYVEQKINSLDFKELNLNEKYIRQCMVEHKRGVRDHSQFLWSLLFLQEWKNKWI